MAWTYYTAPLAAGEELTAAMWYELCEALAERLAATGQTTQVNLTVAASIRDAGLAVQGVPISTSGGAAVLTAWTTILSGTQANWADNTTTPDALTVSAGNSFVTSTQWGAESLTETQWGTLKTGVSNGWGDHRYWNIIRATIRRLQYYRASLGTSGQLTRYATSLVSYADAVTNYAAAPETAGFSGTIAAVLYTGWGGFSVGWVISTARCSAPLTLPNISLFATVDAWIFFQQGGHLITGLSDTITMELAGASSSQLAAIGPAMKVVIGSGLDLRGTHTLKTTLASMSDPSPYEPIPYVSDNAVDIIYTDPVYPRAVILAPSWSKP